MDRLKSNAESWFYLDLGTLNSVHGSVWNMIWRFLGSTASLYEPEKLEALTTSMNDSHEVLCRPSSAKLFSTPCSFFKGQWIDLETPAISVIGILEHFRMEWHEIRSGIVLQKWYFNKTVGYCKHISLHRGLETVFGEEIQEVRGTDWPEWVGSEDYNGESVPSFCFEGFPR